MVNGYVYNVSNHLMNWDDIIVSYKRNDYDGVIRSFSTKFEFVNVAYSLLKDEYRKKYLGAQAIVVVSLRNNSWTWNEIFRCALDFSTFSDDGNVISINAIDNSLASLIKAKKGTQYEYSVDVVGHELASLYYDRINMQNTLNFTIGDTFIVNAIELADVKVSSYNNEIYRGGYLDHDTGEKGVVAVLIGVPPSGIMASLDMDVNYEDSGDGQYVTFTLSSCGNTQAVNIVKGESKKIKLNINVSKSSFESYDQSRVVYFSIMLKASNATHAKININKINEFKIIYKSIGDSIYINVVPPVTLLNRLLKSMNGGKDGYTGTIAPGVDPRLDNCMLVAAESIRGIPNAKIYSSYSKFVNWMSTVFGFVPVIGDNSVSFVHRDSLFRKVVLKELGDMVNDFEYSVNRSLIYSRLRVGYDKQDYDSINGRDEFRFANTFSTGQSLTDNALELISPYRADVYGIEFLAQKRGKDTTDNESDNDVFFVGAKLKTVIVGPPGHGSVAIFRYELIRGDGGYNISGVISPDTMFNAMYSPRSMIMANKKFIGCSTESLIFASSDGNSDVVINGVKESDDIIIEDRLFTVGELSFSTSDNEVLNDWSGEISIEKGGETYQGYVMDTKINSLKSKEVKYTLIVESIK